MHRFHFSADDLSHPLLEQGDRVRLIEAYLSMVSVILEQIDAC